MTTSSVKCLWLRQYLFLPVQPEFKKVTCSVRSCDLPFSLILSFIQGPWQQWCEWLLRSSILQAWLFGRSCDPQARLIVPKDLHSFSLFLKVMVVILALVLGVLEIGDITLFQIDFFFFVYW